MKRFNTTGTCFPNRHYMVDLPKRIEIIRDMVEQGEYFCINRVGNMGKQPRLKR